VGNHESPENKKSLIIGQFPGSGVWVSGVGNKVSRFSSKREKTNEKQGEPGLPAEDRAAKRTGSYVKKTRERRRCAKNERPSNNNISKGKKKKGEKGPWYRFSKTKEGVTGGRLSTVAMSKKQPAINGGKEIISHWMKSEMILAWEKRLILGKKGKSNLGGRITFSKWPLTKGKSAVSRGKARHWQKGLRRKSVSGSPSRRGLPLFEGQGKQRRKKKKRPAKKGGS